MQGAVYLDHNATTPVDPRVLACMLPYFSTYFGNAASRTHPPGWIAAEAVAGSRKQVGSLVGAEEQEIIFTSGATEALNLGIKGVFENYSAKGKHIITVQTEHKAVLDTCLALEKKGAEITYLPVDRLGVLDLELLEQSIRPDTILVCVMHANNETGVIHPIEKIAEIVAEKGSLFLCDATQSAGKMNVDVSSSKIALLAFSAHKMYGPKGSGALYVSRRNPRVVLQAQIEGGGHERGMRSGTLNVPGIVGFGEACALAKAEMWDRSELLSKLRTKLEQFLLDIGGVHINGSTRDRLPNTTNMMFEGIRADELIVLMKDISISTGSACSSANPEPSHVLKAMGLNKDQAMASVRFSLGKDNTEEEIDYTIKHITQAVNKLRNEVL